MSIRAVLDILIFYAFYGCRRAGGSTFLNEVLADYHIACSGFACALMLYIRGKLRRMYGFKVVDMCPGGQR
jgi:hypothetical protein